MFAQMEEEQSQRTFYSAGPSTCKVAPAALIQTFVFGITAPF